MRILASILLFSASAYAAILPDGRIPAGGWKRSEVGVVGGIPTNYVQFCNVKVSIPGTNIVAVGDGVTDDTGALQAAMNLCTNGAYIYLPAGNYKTTAALSRAAVYSYDRVSKPLSIVFRGDGMGVTTIQCYGTSSDIISFHSAISYGYETQTFDSIDAGTTTLTFPSATYYATGVVVGLRMPNDTNVLNRTPSYMMSTVTERARIASITGNDVTFESPIKNRYYTVTTNVDLTATNSNGSTNALVARSWSPIFRCGVEDLTVERMWYAGTDNIYFDGGVECWVKNVESARTVNWAIKFNSGFRCEIRGCKMRETWYGGGNSGYGLGLFGGCTATLVEDNIAYHLRHAYLTEYGGTYNIFGYNYSFEPINGDKIDANHPEWKSDTNIAWTNFWTDQVLTDFATGDAVHHGGDPRYNLWEGNSVVKLSWDWVLGGSRWNTAWRNHLKLAGLPATTITIVEVMAFNTSNNIIGSVIGYPGLTKTDYDYNVAPCIRKWGMLSSGDTDHATKDTSITNPVITLYHQNYDYWTGTNWVDSNLSGTLSNSLYLESKPAWFSNLVWPPFGPDIVGYTNMIPAQARYLGLNYGAPPHRLNIGHLRAGKVRGP